MTKPTLAVAVLGTGVMGAPMARNLLTAGFEVRVWNRTSSKAEALLADGASLASRPAEVAAGTDVVITMLTDGAAVEDVMGGPDGALSVLGAGAIWMQMSTVGVEWTDRLAELACRHGVHFVDAPVSGSSASAEQHALVVLASGAGEVRTQVEPVFDALGNKTVWLDRLGDGSRLKLALNNWLVVLVEGMVESLTLTEALGVDPHLFLKTVADGPMTSDYAITKGVAMVTADFAPVFPLHHAAKDAELALSAAHSRGLELPLINALLPRWQKAIATDHGDEDVAAAVTAADKIIGAA